MTQDDQHQWDMKFKRQDISLAKTAEISWEHSTNPDDTNPYPERTSTIKLTLHRPNMTDRGVDSSHPINEMLESIEGKVVFEHSLTGAGCSQYTNWVESQQLLALTRYLISIHPEWTSNDVLGK